jgi:hypothetical protein
MRTLLLIAMLGSTADADDNEIWLGGGSRALRSSSADAVTGDSLGVGSLGYARRLELPAPVAVWIDAGFGWGGADGTMFQTLQTQLDTYAFTAGVRASYRLHRLVDATARVDLGTARTALALSDGMTTESDSGWGALVQGALGTDLYAARSPVFALGVRVELGYTRATGVALAPRADMPSDTLKIATTQASIGHLDLSGPFLVVSALTRF